MVMISRSVSIEDDDQQSIEEQKMSRIPGTKRRHTHSEAHSRKSFLSQLRGNCVDASMLIYTTYSVSSPFVVDRLRSTVNEKNMYIKRCFNKPEYYACLSCLPSRVRVLDPDVIDSDKPRHFNIPRVTSRAVLNPL